MFFTKQKTELPYDLAIPSWGIYSYKSITEKYTCKSMFIATLFTIAKAQKQSRCPSTDEERKCGIYIYSGILLIHKKNKTMPS